MSFQGTLRLLRVTSLVAVAFLAVAAASSAELPRWVKATPFGGWVTALAQAPSAPRILYAATQKGSLSRSLDGGATWNRRGSWAGDYAITDLIVAPWDVQTVYALTVFPTLYRSRDGGRTWT